MAVLEKYAVSIGNIYQTMKKANLWKAVALGIVCIKQEYRVYECLAKDRFFDMTKFLEKTVERLWKAAETGYSMDEKYLLTIEESIFTPRDVWEEMALQIVRHLQDVFFAVNTKNAKALLSGVEKQLGLIEQYAQAAGLSTGEKDALVEAVLEHHNALAVELMAVAAKDKKKYIAELSSRELAPMLGTNFTEKLPGGKGEKTAKKKLPELRATSFEFDLERQTRDNAWLLRSTPEQWVLGRAADRDKAGAFGEYYRNRDYLDLCYVMANSYRLLAEADYVQHGDVARAKGFWYLSAFSWLRAYQLREKGFPIRWVPYFAFHESGKDGFQPVFLIMACAYASGEESLLKEIQRFSSEREQPVTGLLLRMMQGEDMPDMLAEVEQWEECRRKDMVLAILRQDTTALRKYIIERIRIDRRQYDLNRTMVDPETYAFLRLAKKRGLEVQPVIAAEILMGETGDIKIDKGYFKLPYESDIEEWLAVNA